MTDYEKLEARLSRIEKFLGMVLQVCGICQGLGRVLGFSPNRNRVCAECAGLGTVVTNTSKED